MLNGKANGGMSNSRHIVAMATAMSTVKAESTATGGSKRTTARAPLGGKKYDIPTVYDHMSTLSDTKIV